MPQKKKDYLSNAIQAQAARRGEASFPRDEAGYISPHRAVQEFRSRGYGNAQSVNRAKEFNSAFAERRRIQRERSRGVQ